MLGPDQPPTAFGAIAGTLETLLSDGTAAIVTVRNLKSPLGQVVLAKPKAQALSAWSSDTALTVTLSATTGFVVLILGFAFHWQSMRAREADIIHELVRRRVDTALNRGRCGLWDWDLARGRIFWSQSMFAILGQDPRDRLFDFGEINELVHTEDVALYDLAKEIAEGRTNRSMRFPVRHAHGHWVWLRYYTPQSAPNEYGLPSWHRGRPLDRLLAEQTAAANVRLRDHRDHPKRVLWAPTIGWGYAIQFQALHNLPDEAVAAGMLFDQIISRRIVERLSAG